MKKITDRASHFKLSWWEKITLPFIDSENRHNIFYSSKRTAKIYFQKIDKDVEETNYSENFIEDWQVIFASAVKEIKENGYWTISSVEPNEHHQYISGFLESFPLNGLHSIKLINKSKYELLFVDTQMSSANRKRFEELTATQRINVSKNIEYFYNALKQIEEKEKIFYK